MSTEEKQLNSKQVKRYIKKVINDPSIKISSAGSEILTAVASEFIEIISLAGLDFSNRPKQYVDSSGIIKALRELGFGDIADMLPDLSQFTEDMQYIN